MRKIYFLLLLLSAMTGAWGQILTENFNYTAGTLLTANGWANHSGTTNFIAVSNGGLTYTGHPGSGIGNAVSMTTSGEDVNKQFTAINSGSVYMSFLVNISAVQTGDYFIGLFNNSSTFPVRVYAKTATGGFNFGVSKNAGAVTYESNVRSLGTVYLVVINYVFGTGAGDDIVNLWVNPTLGATEPGATIPGVNATGDLPSIVGVYLRQGGASSSSTQQVDAILVGDTWASVTPLAGGSTATLANLTPQASGSITQGTSNAVLAGFSITPTASSDFTAITVTSTGTATSTDISNVRIFRDNDGNGAINGADAAVAGATAQLFSASMVFSGITGQTGLTAQTNYLVVADIAGVGVSTPGSTVTVSSNSFTTTATSNVGSFAGNSRTIVAPPGATTITAGAGSEATTISSLTNTQGAAVLNFDFTITDDGGTPATDGAASQISQIILNAGTGNTVTNWTTAIAGVELSDGTNSTTTATIGASSITFAGITNTPGTLGYIADDASKTYTVKIWLNTNLGALRNVIDGQNFVFRIQTADVSVSGSQLATGQDVNSGPTNNVVDVTATALAFVSQPANTNVNTAMSAVSVSVVDANGNRDLGATTSVAITSSGTLTGSPVIASAVAGLATFNGLTHTATGAGLTLNAERNGTGDWDVVSNTFNITNAPIAAWDFTGPGNVATFTATTFDANLVATTGAKDITRGAGAAASAGANSFRTTGFQNNGISTANTDYFQVTLTAQPGYDLSLSSIDGFLNGTSGYAVSPGVSNQFAYSLDGTNFTLIGAPTVTVGQPVTMPTIDLTGVAALQNVAGGTTITLRYYASGQTTTGGWGFYSASAGTNGLAIGGTLTASSSASLTVAPGSLPFGQQAVGGTTASQSVNLSGVNLTGAPGNITVTAPTDFEVSNDNSTWGASTTIAYSSATLASTPVYVRFAPLTAGAKSGNVTFSGGGDATPPVVAVTGSGTITYYSKAAGNLTDVATWGPNPDGTGSSPANFTADAQVFTIANRSAVTLDANWTVSGTGSKIVIGNGSSATDLTIPDPLAITGTIDMATLGKLTMQSNTVSHTYGTLAANSTIDYAQSGTFSIPGTVTYQNLKLTGGTKTLAGNTTTINGNLTFDNMTIGAPGSTPFATIDLNGDLTYTGTVVNPADASSFTLIMNGGATQTINANGNTVRAFRLTASSNTAVILADGTTSILAGNASGGGVEIGAGSSINVNTNTISTFNGGTRINGTAGNTGTFITNGGSSFNLTSTSTGNSTLYFDATNNSIQNLTVNFTGTGVLVIGSNATATGAVTLTKGKISIPENITLNVSSGNITVSTLDNTTHFLTAANTTTGAKGFLRVGNISSAFTAWVGNGTLSLPCSVSPTTTSDFSFCVFTGVTANGEPNGTPFTTGQKKDVVDAVWIINRNGGSGDVAVNANWQASLEGPGFATLADAEIGISRFNGTNWDIAAGTGDNTANSAIRLGVNTFSPFGVGRIGLALPVNFSNIRASQVSSGVKVEWSNLTEIDVLNYSVERSTDGRNFTAIGQQDARLNNGGKADYSFIDANPAAGVNYYRIRSLETGSRVKYSITVKVDLRGGATQLVLYPNPSNGTQLGYQAVNLVKGQYTIRVINAMGQQVYSQSLNHAGGSVSESISLPALKPGLYSLQFSSENNKLVKPFVVQ